MNELERLQRRRFGEAVPAPITVDVNVNDEREATDGRHVAQASLPSLGVLSIPATGRLIGSGIPAEIGTALVSNDDATPFCETNPSFGNSRAPDPS